MLEAKRFSGRNGLALAADVGGSPADPPVILMHGGGQTRGAWGEAAEALAARAYHVISLDLRGHGASAWDPDGVYDIDAYIDDLKEVMRTLPGPPALVGASLGGVTGLIALGEDARLAATALVLVDVTPRIDPEGSKRIGGFMRANPHGFASLEEAADAIAAYLPHRPRPQNLDGLRRNLRHDNGRWFWHWDPQFVGSRGPRPETTRPRMLEAATKVHIPTLLVRGSLSEIVTPAGVTEFRRLMPQAEYVDIEGAGHMVAGDKNSAFQDAVIEFLARHVRRGVAQ